MFDCLLLIRESKKKRIRKKKEKRKKKRNGRELSIPLAPQLSVLNHQYNMLNSLSDKPFHYLWVNVSCHPEYGENFGISSESLPTLLVAKPRQRLFTILKQNFDKEHISDFLSTVLLGKEDLLRYSRFNDMLPVDCSNLQPPGEDAGGANG